MKLKEETVINLIITGLFVFWLCFMIYTLIDMYRLYYELSF